MAILIKRDKKRTKRTKRSKVAPKGVATRGNNIRLSVNLSGGNLSGGAGGALPIQNSGVGSVGPLGNIPQSIGYMEKDLGTIVPVDIRRGIPDNIGETRLIRQSVGIVKPQTPDVSEEKFSASAETMPSSRPLYSRDALDKMNKLALQDALRDNGIHDVRHPRSILIEKYLTLGPDGRVGNMMSGQPWQNM